jgi:hypothetical protein
MLTPEIEHRAWILNNEVEPEGWAIFDTDGELELCCYDECETFGDDADAWRHVVRKANEGSALHAEAIEIIREANPAEYQRIVAHVTQSAVTIIG